MNLPMKKWWFFSSYVSHYQRVSLVLRWAEVVLPLHTNGFIPSDLPSEIPYMAITSGES